jgi:hypothetical protein
VRVASRWLVEDWQWPYAAAFAACFLLALLPIVWSEAGVAGMLIYAQLPFYMLHQLEEHAGDRFRLYVNQRLADGREALGRRATFLVNLTAMTSRRAPTCVGLAGHLAIVAAVAVHLLRDG